MRVPGCTMEMLLAVVATVESRTKAQAADKLNISVSALDKRLRSAASLLQAPLFESRGEEIEPTEEGRIFHASALRSVELAAFAEESTRAHVLLKTNILLVGHSCYLPPEVLRLIRGLQLPERPRVRIEHRPGLTPSLVQQVAEGKLHAGIGFPPVEMPGFLSWTILEEALVACIPASHPLARRPTIHAEDLREVPVVAVSRETVPAMHRQIEDYFGALDVTLRVVADAYTPSDAMVLVEQQVGICFLARSSIRAYKGVVVRPLWTEALIRRTAFFVREDSRSPLILELAQAVQTEAAKLRRG